MTVPEMDNTIITEEAKFGPEEIRARVAHVEKVRETWKGNAEYRDVLDMELWCLITAEKLLDLCRQVVIFQANEQCNGAVFPEQALRTISRDVCMRMLVDDGLASMVGAVIGQSFTLEKIQAH